MQQWLFLAYCCVEKNTPKNKWNLGCMHYSMSWRWVKTVTSITDTESREQHCALWLRYWVTIAMAERVTYSSISQLIQLVSWSSVRPVHVTLHTARLAPLGTYPHTRGFLFANINHVHYLWSLLLRPSEEIGPEKITPHTTGKSDMMSFANIRQSGLC